MAEFSSDEARNNKLDALTDEELMREIQRGRLDGYVALFNRYWQIVHRFYIRLGADPQRGEDLTQDVFINLWQFAPRYKPRGKFSTFLFTIAKNHFIDEQRKASRRFIDEGGRRALVEPGFEDSQVEHFADASGYQSAASPAEEAVTSELGDQLEQALSKLPEEQRLVVVLSEYCGLSYREIAQVLNCPVGTVSSRKSVALERLRELLSEFKHEWDAS